MDKPWKQEERTVARAFNTRRMLMKGTKEKADVKHELFHVDVKLRQRWNIDKWFSELQKTAGNKIPILIVRKPRKHQRLAVLPFNMLVALLKGNNLI